MSGEGFGAMAYWNGHVYFAANNDALRDYSLAKGQLTPPSSSANKFEMGATPSISANGNKDAVVWLLMVGIMFPLQLQSQESQWQNLAQIRSGAKVQVIEQSLKSAAGRFVRFSTTDLTLKVGNKELVVPKDEVYRVTVNGKNRKRNMLIGLAAGAAMGVIVGVASPELGTGTCSQGSCIDAGTVSLLAVAGGALGTGVGAALPAAKTVYRAGTPKQASLQAPVRKLP